VLHAEERWYMVRSRTNARPEPQALYRGCERFIREAMKLVGANPDKWQRSVEPIPTPEPPA
jgi:hypothetical protein